MMKFDSLTCQYKFISIKMCAHKMENHFWDILQSDLGVEIPIFIKNSLS